MTRVSTSHSSVVKRTSGIVVYLPQSRLPPEHYIPVWRPTWQCQGCRECCWQVSWNCQHGMTRTSCCCCCCRDAQPNVTTLSWLCCRILYKGGRYDIAGNNTLTPEEKAKVDSMSWEDLLFNSFQASPKAQANKYTGVIRSKAKAFWQATLGLDQEQ